MINLDKAKVQAAARRAYEEGRLQAQKNPGDGCLYRDDFGNPCAIGAALTDEEAQTIIDAGLNAIEIRSFRPGGPHTPRIPITSDDWAYLSHLQDAHDSWSVDEEDEAQFKEVLDA